MKLGAEMVVPLAGTRMDKHGGSDEEQPKREKRTFSMVHLSR